MRNLAFHRAGMRGEVQSKLLLDRSHQHVAFWCTVHSNFYDMCVLDWCKLFAEPDGKHHWRRVVNHRDRGRFEADLHAKLGVTAVQFDGLVEQILIYRDKFVAHLDNKREMHFPSLDVPKAAVVFLHERLMRQAAKNKNWGDLPTTTEELELGYEQASREAQSVYDEALGVLDL